MTRSMSARSTSSGCARCWPACRCRGCSAGGSCWPSTPHPGCARTPRPRPSGCSATSTAALERPTRSRRAGRISWWPRWKADRRAGRRCWTRAGWARPRTPPRSPPSSCARRSAGCARPGTGGPGARRGWGCLRAAGPGGRGARRMLVVLDAGYDVCRLAFVLADLPIQLIGRLRADRVLLTALAPPAPGGPRPTGRPRRHGAVMTLADPGSWPTPSTDMTSQTARYGRAQALSWDRMHPRLAHRGAWAAHPGPLPIVEGTLIRLQVEQLPGARAAKPVWLWTSAPDADAETVTRCWQAYLRRFDLEHTIRFAKQTLGWTRPKLRSPAAADRWTWLILAAHTELRLARPLAVDLRRPWERPLPAGRLTPARVRRGFRYLRAKTPCPAGAPKPAHPGPGRPPGMTNRHRAPRYDVGKTTRDAADTRKQQVKG